MLCAGQGSSLGRYHLWAHMACSTCAHETVGGGYEPLGCITVRIVLVCHRKHRVMTGVTELRVLSKSIASAMLVMSHMLEEWQPRPI